MAHDVFISYSSKDEVDANIVCSKLEEASISCFIAHRDIPKGVDWADVIPEAIEQCKCLICIHSDHTNESRHVSRELTIADNKKKPLISFRIEDVEYKKTSEYYLSSINWISNKEVHALEKLVNTVQEKLNLPVIKPTNKILVGAFYTFSVVLVFGVLFILGFLHAYYKSSSKKELLITASQIVNKSRDHVQLIYSLTDESFVFNRRDKTIIKIPFVDFDKQILEKDNLSDEAKVGYVGIGALLSKAFHVKVKGRQAVYYYALVAVSIVCGYGAGYYVHERFYPASKSDKMKDFLSVRENWIMIDQLFQYKESFQFVK